MIEPLRLSFDVGCSPAHAFAVWTERASSWWPASHTVTQQPELEIVFEGRPGGRIFERAADGSEHDWGEVTAWDPPHRLVYLWHLRVDRADATEVEITFVPRDGATRVEIEHRGWELVPDGRARRDANGAGWAGLLPHFTAATQ